MGSVLRSPVGQKLLLPKFPYSDFNQVVRNYFWLELFRGNLPLDFLAVDLVAVLEDLVGLRGVNVSNAGALPKPERPVSVTGLGPFSGPMQPTKVKVSTERTNSLRAMAV